MRFHSDPLYSTWNPATAVVSIGASRRFAFRAIDNYEVCSGSESMGIRYCLYLYLMLWMQALYMLEV